MHGTTAKARPNVLDKTVGDQFRDPLNYDFRPRADRTVAKTGAGAYDLTTTAAGAAACAAGGARYWIPGRQEWRASSPVPPHGSLSVDPRLDLMFVPAFGELDSGCNVQDVPAAPLEGTWWWRVDSLDEQGNVLAHGEEWQFTIRSGPSPSPSPTPTPPGPQVCVTCENEHCPGQVGQGHACEKCVEANRDAFMAAGCYESGWRHAFLNAWCHSNSLVVV